MTKLVLTALLAAAVASPALAADTVQPLDFTRDGIHYVGTVTVRPNGHRLIAGHEVASGRSFALDVANGMVTGNYDFNSVVYAAPRSAKPAIVATAAAPAIAVSSAGF